MSKFFFRGLHVTVSLYMPFSEPAVEQRCRIFLNACFVIPGSRLGTGRAGRFIYQFSSQRLILNAKAHEQSSSCKASIRYPHAT
jgi:hypothetical protein